MIARWTTLLAAAVAVAALAAGCGGDDNGNGTAAEGESAGATAGAGEDAGSGGAPSSLSKAQLIKRADAACGEQQEGLLEAMTEFAEESKGEGNSGANPAVELVTEVLLPRAEAQTDALAELGAPAGDEQELEAILEARRQAAADLETGEGIESLAAFRSRFAKANRLAGAYGLGACSETLNLQEEGGG